MSIESCSPHRAPRRAAAWSAVFLFLSAAAGVAPSHARPLIGTAAGDPLRQGMSGMGYLAHLSATGQLQHSGARARAAGTTRPDGQPPEEEGENPAGGQAEVAIAVDETGAHVVVGSNDSRGFGSDPISVSAFAWSDDGGVTFTDGGQLPTPGGDVVGSDTFPQIFGDPDVKYVPGGFHCQFIYASIMVRAFPDGGPFTGEAQTLCIHRSTDCGHTWEGPFEITPATNPNGMVSSGSAEDAADKELIDVNRDTGRVIVSWSNFTPAIPGGVEISTTYSDDIMTGSPPTWSAREVLNPGSTTFDTGSMPRFAGASSSNVYVVWSTTDSGTVTPYGFWPYSNVQIAVSPDDGDSWGPPDTLQFFPFFPVDYIPGNDRIHSFPSLAVDTSGGPNDGHVYVVYESNDSGDGGDVLFQRSINGGVSFSFPPVPLNASPGLDRAQWFPYATVDNLTGRLSVIFYDQGVSPSGDLMETTRIFTDDGGVNWSPPAPVSERPFHGGYGNDLGQPNLGDYIGATAQGDVLYAAWGGAPPLVGFADGQPGAQFTVPDVYVRAVSDFDVPIAALRLGDVSFTDSGGNGAIDDGETVSLQIPLTNPVTNGAIFGTAYSVSATLSTTTPGVSVPVATNVYNQIDPGTTTPGTNPFVLAVAPDFVPGTKIELALDVTASQNGPASTTLHFTLNTGTPVPTTIFTENFDAGAPDWFSGYFPPAPPLPSAPWAVFPAGGFCSSPSPYLGHSNPGTGPRWQDAVSPMITVPADSEYVTLDFDICTDTENDADFGVLAYDGFTLRIQDQTAGRSPRRNLVEAFAEEIKTGASFHFPKHLSRYDIAPNYMNDMSVWGGDSGGIQHVQMRLPGMVGSTVALEFDYTEDNVGTCADVRAGHSCGVLVDNIVMKSVKSVPNVCTGGVGVTKPRVTIKLGGPGADKIAVKGTAAFPGALPTPPLDLANLGMRLQLVDVGAGSTVLLDQTIPGGLVGTQCGPKDGWKTNKTSTSHSYKNKTNQVPGGCVAGSAHGITKASAKDLTAKLKGVKFSVKGANGTYSPVTGPLRMTVVLGGAAESAAGQCGRQEFTALQCVVSAKTVKCK